MKTQVLKAVTFNGKSNMFQDALDYVKDIKFGDVLLAAAHATGKAYRTSKQAASRVQAFVSKHWKNALLGGASLVVAGTVVHGTIAAVFTGTAIYAGVKTLAHYMAAKRKQEDISILGDFASQLWEGLVYNTSAMLGLVFGGAVIYAAIAKAYVWFTYSWVYALYFVAA